jgi:PAS domain S-box-containing protein
MKMSMFPDLMSKSSDGVFAIDSDQTIVFWNRACEGLTGISATEAIGRCCDEVLRGRDPMGRPLCNSKCPLSELANGGLPPSKLPMRVTHSDGQTMQLNVGTMLVPSAHEAAWNVVHIMRRGHTCDPSDLFLGDPAADKGSAHSARREDEGDVRGCLLTGREREILRLLAQGSNVKAMSGQLHISVTTVRNHLQRMMAKLDVHSRVEAVAYAHKQDLL